MACPARAGYATHGRKIISQKNEEHLMNKLVLSALVVVTSIAAASGALAQDTAAGKTTFNMQGLPFDRRRRPELNALDGRKSGSAPDSRI